MPEPMTDDLTEHLRTAEATATLLPAARAVAALLCERFAAGHGLWTLGNGGSAADAQHLTGEMVGRFKRERRPLPAVTLSTDPTVMTCIANDYRFDDVFSRQLLALARPGDVVAAFTTSGRSPDVVDALRVARGRGATTVLFGGGDGGPAAAHADHALLVPSTTTARIQEMHTFLLHAVSEVVDLWAVGTEPAAEAAAAPAADDHVVGTGSPA
ncbi:SIS domain-containing protein [Microlunatus capsulatus]|uniref:D-sedoheptulose 7-phosphate isomerase n=1 Tax=Microlunatus capsulatus TaxID=99117 RepID=A0ABS4ZCD4_9ACTN|nr:SIS domain-containing protein [Microlunatus capsulatus]MBP2418686.1 D-sedoheptulose 7-phosphate isomerase [Microlunatus capsulatus]